MDTYYTPSLAVNSYAANHKIVTSDVVDLDLLKFSDGTQMVTAPVIPPTQNIGYYQFNGSAAGDVLIPAGTIQILGGPAAAGFGVVNVIKPQSSYSNSGAFLSFNDNIGLFTIGSGIFKMTLQMCVQSTTADPPSVVMTLNYNGIDVESRESNLFVQRGGASTVHENHMTLIGVYDTRSTSGGTFSIKIDNTHVPNHDVTIYRPTADQVKFIVERIL